MDTSKANYEAGKAVGTTQEKSNNMMDMAGNAAISAKDSVLGAGKVVQDKTGDAINYVKDAVAPKK